MSTVDQGSKIKQVSSTDQVFKADLESKADQVSRSLRKRKAVCYAEPEETNSEDSIVSYSQTKETKNKGMKATSNSSYRSVNRVHQEAVKRSRLDVSDSDLFGESLSDTSQPSQPINRAANNQGN